MNDRQKELMEKITKMQKKATRKRERALQFGYILMIVVTTTLSWVVWTLLAQIEGIPYLTYWQSLVYNLLVFSIIFFIARIVRSFQKGK